MSDENRATPLLFPRSPMTSSSCTHWSARAGASLVLNMCSQTLLLLATETYIDVPTCSGQEPSRSRLEGRFAASVSAQLEPPSVDLIMRGRLPSDFCDSVGRCKLPFRSMHLAVISCWSLIDSKALGNNYGRVLWHLGMGARRSAGRSFNRIPGKHRWSATAGAARSIA
jgi:hypothetical protein